MNQTFTVILLVLAWCPLSLSQTTSKVSTNQTRRTVTWEEISSLPAPAADHRISYGNDPLNFGDLRLPNGPEQSARFAKRAQDTGDPVEVWQIEGAGHFDLIAPFAPAWTRVERAVVSLLAGW